MAIEKGSEIFNNITVYGVSKLLKRERLFSKLLWLSFIFISSAASIYYTWDAINSYLKYEVITKIESKYQQPMLFPTISFCAYEPKAFDNKTIKSIVKECWFNLDKG